MIGVCNLGGKAAYSGVIGNDLFGKIFNQKLKLFGVVPYLVKKEGSTGSSVILVTPDSERTMNTHLGVCSMLGKQHIKEEFVKNCQVFHTTAYALDTTPDAVIHALEIAKNNNVKISFDLSDPFLVKKQKQLLQKMIQLYSDVVFLNREEAALFGGGSAEHALEQISKHCETVALKLGSEGSIVSHIGNNFHIDAFDVRAIDTTGAGDMYAAGFLYGLTHGYDIEECGKIASYSASKIVEVIGARIDYSLEKQIRQEFG